MTLRTAFLVEADLSTCVITTIPEDIGNLAKLKALNLSRNPVTSGLKHLPSLPELETLKLDECGLEALPANFGEFRSLKHLSLQHNRIANLEVVHPNVEMDLDSSDATTRMRR